MHWTAAYFRYYLDKESLINKCFLNLFFQGNLESSYVKSVLDIYELVLQTSPNFKNDSTDKVKQEVLRGLGNYSFLLFYSKHQIL